MKRACLTVLGLVLIALAPGPLDAQVDVAKALPGKWEGRLEAFRGGDPARTLVISSVKGTAGTWTAQGRFGVTGKNLGKVEIPVNVVGSDVWLEFTSGAGAKVALKLSGDKALRGTVRPPGFEKDFPIQLEKVPE